MMLITKCTCPESFELSLQVPNAIVAQYPPSKYPAVHEWTKTLSIYENNRGKDCEPGNTATPPGEAVVPG